MKKCLKRQAAVGWLARGVGIAVSYFLATMCGAQEAAPGSAAKAPGASVASTQEVTAVSDRVTINVVNGNMSDVLNAFSRQTGKNIVIGPSVSTVTNTVNLRLSDTPWDEALDVILKTSGLSYKVVGKTVVVNKQKELETFEISEPLASKVFTLKYLDASDVIEMVNRQLTTNRGSATILAVKGQKGWEFESRMSGGSRGSVGGVGAAGTRERVKDADTQTRSKTIIVKDTPTVLEAVSLILAEIDQMPSQILIESRFVEVNSGFLRDIGVEFGTGATGAETPGVQAQGHRAGSSLYGLGMQQISGTVTPPSFPASSGLNSQNPFAGGLSLKFQQLTDTQFEVLLHMLQQDSSMNVLSAPRILTLNNQEATINVGQKFPIIRSDVSGGNSTSVSTSLDYYENIGIQLNVVPQVCGSNYVSMIVHPAVTTFIRSEKGVVVTGSGEGSTSVPQTSYPVLSTREAETQIVLRNGTTIVIGGLLDNRETGTRLKVPILGDLPLVGALFRRDTKNTEKIDLLIFLTASIVPSAEKLDVDDAARAVERLREARAPQDRAYERTASGKVDSEQLASAKRVVAVNQSLEQAAGGSRAKDAKDQAESAKEAERVGDQESKKAKEAARLQAEEDRKVQAEAAARVAADEKAKEEAVARAAEQQKAQLKAARDAEKARLAAEAKAKEEAEAEREVQAKAAKEAEKAKMAAEKAAKAEAARLAEEQRKAEKARLAAEQKAKEEADAKAESEREAQAKAAKEAEKAKIAAEKQARLASEAQAKAAREVEEARLAAEAQAKTQAEAQRKAQLKAARDAEKARLAAEAKAKEEAEAKAEGEREVQAKAAKEAEKAKMAAEKAAKAEAARLAEEQRKAEKARLAAERKAKEEADAKAESEREAQAKAAKEAEKARIAAEKQERGEQGFFSWLFGRGAKSQAAAGSGAN